MKKKAAFFGIIGLLLLASTGVASAIPAYDCGETDISDFRICYGDSLWNPFGAWMGVCEYFDLNNDQVINLIDLGMYARNYC